MSNTTIGIIGGSGSMGRWFGRYFMENGHTVLIAGRSTSLSYEELAQKCDVVILSVPLHAVGPICSRIGSLMSAEQLLMDICSLKKSVMESMLSTTSAQVVGTHPLFGPSTDNLRGQNIIICPGRGTGWQTWLEKLFESSNAVLTHMDPVDHDRYMAVVQGLTHLLTICVGRTLQKLNMPPSDVKRHTTPVFRTQLDLVGRLFAQDLELYHGLIKNNSHIHETLDTFFSVVKEARDRIVSGQPEDGIAFMREIREFLGPFCQKGFDESNILLRSLYSGIDRK